MSWIVAGVAAVGAVKGGMDAKANKKQQAKNDHFRKTAIQYSPWSGMGDPGHISAGNTSVGSGLLGGAMQGASIGMLGQDMLGKLGDRFPTKTLSPFELDER